MCAVGALALATRRLSERPTVPSSMGTTSSSDWSAPACCLLDAGTRPARRLKPRRLSPERSTSSASGRPPAAGTVPYGAGAYSDGAPPTAACVCTSAGDAPRASYRQTVVASPTTSWRRFPGQAGRNGSRLGRVSPVRVGATRPLAPHAFDDGGPGSPASGWRRVRAEGELSGGGYQGRHYSEHKRYAEEPVLASTTFPAGLERAPHEMAYRAFSQRTNGEPRPAMLINTEQSRAVAVQAATPQQRVGGFIERQVASSNHQQPAVNQVPPCCNTGQSVWSMVLTGRA